MTDQFKAFAKEYKENNEKNASKDWPQFILQVCVAVGVAIYTIITAGIFCISSRALSVQRDTEIRQLRAYISVDPTPVRNFVEKKAPSAGVRITVQGQTPAYNLILLAYIAALPYPFRGDIWSLPTSSAPTETASTMLAPTQHTGNYATLTYAPDPNQFEIINSGKTARLYVWGEVHYKDAFRASWYNRFAIPTMPPPWMGLNSNCVRKEIAPIINAATTRTV